MMTSENGVKKKIKECDKLKITKIVMVVQGLGRISSIFFLRG